MCARADNAVKVVIISGAGDKALASGADIREIHDRDYLKMLQGTASTALKELEDLYKPVICATMAMPLAAVASWPWPVISALPPAAPNLASLR